MSMFTKIANVVHGTAITGLVGFFGYHSWQIVSKSRQGLVQHETIESTYFEDMQKKVNEEYETKYGKTDTRDWYDKEDQSWMKNLLRANKPKPSTTKEEEETKQQQ